MNITLYQFAKKVNSTKRPSSGTVYNCYLLDQDTNLYNPRVVIRNVTENIRKFWNYALIVDFARYYFIVDKKIINKNEMELTLECDVLATYRSDIVGYEGQLARCSSESRYNENVVDSMISPTVALRNETTITATSGATDFDTFNQYGVGGSVSFVYYGDGASGGAGDTGGGYINSTQAPQYVLGDLFGIADMWDSFVIGETDPAKYIKNIIWIPAKYSSGYTGSLDINLGKVTASIINARHLTGERSLTIQKTFTFRDTSNSYVDEYEDWRDYDNRFTSVTLEAPFIGLVSIEPKYLRYDNIILTYHIDMGTGDTIATLSATRPGKSIPIGRYVINIGVPMPISMQNIDTAGVKNSLKSLISASTGNISANIDLLDNIAIGSATGFENVECLGGSGSTADLSSMACNIIIVRQGSTSNATTERGKPCMGSSATPVNGAYHEYVNPRPTITGGTKRELEQVTSLMKSGFYYE
ncbi:MAG: hypothetical protein J6S67_06115 [Methanobrevibacter sp.]|nr:hypothetical protein [Methanobrevibacter sp.]